MRTTEIRLILPKLIAGETSYAENLNDVLSSLPACKTEWAIARNMPSTWSLNERAYCSWGILL